MKKIVLAAAMVLGTYMVSAQAPEKMSYQAIVRNITGQLLTNQNVAVRVSVLQGSANGTVVYSERVTGTTNANGLLSLEIGSGTVLAGTFNTVNWGSSSYFLKTETDPSGGTNYNITGTSQLLSVPYALYAKSSGGGNFTLPYTNSLSNASELFALTNNGDGSSIVGRNASSTSSISAVKGEVTNTSPGGYSSAVRGVNSGTGGLGIGVWGSQAGSGWGVYGATPSGYGVYGYASGNGTGVYAYSNTGTGLVGSSDSGIAANIAIFNTTNNNNVLNASTLGNGAAINATASGSGNAIKSTSAGGSGVDASTAAMSSAGVLGRNNGAGEAVVGLTKSDVAGAVVGRNDGGGYGVRGFISGDKSGNAIGVYGQVGTSSSLGRAGKFENVNKDNDSTTLEVSTIGNGNAGDFFVNNTQAISAAVHGKVNSIFSNFGTSAIYGENVGTGGTAGLFYTSNTTNPRPSILALTEGTGEAIIANAKDGNGVESSINGSGYAVYGYSPAFSTGKAGYFKNFNPSNGSPTFTIINAGTGSDLLVNHTGASGNLAVFQTAGANVARINMAGRAFFNGGTQNSGADVAEAFDVEGIAEHYETGDILVISTTSDRTVEKSSEPYSNLVAGVYATKPGVLLTEDTIDSDLSGKIPMGVIGVIPTKVCLEGGSIKRGDLLVTSSTGGVAMKADLQKVKIGQVLGKALQDYNNQSIGKIKVLVSIK